MWKQRRQIASAMKWSGIVLIFVLCELATCQTQTATNDVEGMIRRQIGAGPRTGQDAKQIPRMGDAAAVAITKVMGDKSLTAAEIERILGIVHGAFLQPSLVHNVSDRKPGTTLLLLQHLDLSTSDTSLKAKIAAEKTFMLARLAKPFEKDTRDCQLANFTAAEPDSPAQTTRESYQLGQVYTTLTDPARTTNATFLLRMGDGVADFLNTIIDGCTLSPVDEQRALDIVRGAFSSPQAILAATDREPKRVLSLLDSLDASTEDQNIRAGIADTRRYVFGQQSMKN